MAFRIDDIRTQLKQGGARPSLFQVVMTPPPGLSLNRGNAARGAEKFRFLCKSSQMPDSTIAPIDVPYFGRKYKVAGNRVFGDWTTTILNDEDFAIRDMFEDWMGRINEHSGNLQTAGSAPSNYQTTVDFLHYGKSGQIIKNYKFMHAWPTAIAAIEASWETADSIEEFAVTWSYSWWEARTTDGTTSIIDNLL